MATPEREYSLDYHLLEHMKYSGIERDNLNDLVSIVVSLKNKYGIVPLTAAAQSSPVPNGLRLSYVIESIALNKMLNVLMDVPRLQKILPFLGAAAQQDLR